MNTPILALVLCLAPLAASAQTPPATLPPGGGVAFTASLDHDTKVGTVPVLLEYRLEFALASAPTAIIKAVSLGKPTPAADKTITVLPIAEFATMPQDVYVLYISSVGPDQITRSVAGDPLPRVAAPRAAGKPSPVKPSPSNP